MRYWDCYRCGGQIPFDGKIKVVDGQVYHPSCQAKSPADLPEAGASAERISSVVRSNATTGWIKVSEWLPKYKQKVLLYNKNLRYPHVGEMVFSDERGSHFKCETIVFDCFEGKKDCCRGFTHWMPLPGIPEV